APQADAAGADAGLQLLAEGGTRLAIGASFTRSTVKRRTEASIIGAPVTATGALHVSADTTGCITNVGLGAGIILTGQSNASAGAVISILPVTTHTIAAIEQASGVNEPLSIRAESLSLHATEDWRVRNWALGAGLSKGVGIGAVISWADYSGSDVSARIRNSAITTTGTLPGSADDQANVDIFADSSRQMFMVTAGASAGSTVAVSASVNYMNFAGTVDAGLTGSTLTTPGDLRLGTHVYRGLSGLMGSLSFNLDADGLASVGAAFAYATFDDTATALVSSSHINAARGATLAADGKTELGYYGGSVGLSSGKVGFDGTVAVLKNKAVNQAQALNSSFTLSSGALTLHAASTGVFNTAFLSPSIGIGDTALNVGLTVAYLDDTATATALLKNSEAQARDITLQATGECTLEGLAAGLATAGKAAITGQALATTIAHNITAQAVNSSLTTTAGQLKVLADNSVTIGRARQGYVAGGISAAFNGVGIGASVSFIDIVDKVRANLDNCSATVAGNLLVQATEDAYLRSYSATLAGGFYGGGAVNVNRAVLRSYTQADINADSAKTITTGGDLSLRSENKQSLELNTWGMAGGIYGAAAVGVSYANMAGGSNAAITGALTLDVRGNLLLDARTTRTASYLAINVAAAVYGAVNVAVSNLYLGDATEAYSKNADDQNQVKSAKDGALSAIDDVLTEATSVAQANCGLTLGSFSSMQELEASMAPEKPQTEAKLSCTEATVSGSSTIQATDTLTSTPKNINVTGGGVAVGVHVNNTTIDSVTLATVGDNTKLTSRGDILISADHSATDTYHAVPVTGGVIGIRVSTYSWNEKSLTRTAVGNGVTLDSTQGSLSLRNNASASETFTHTGVGVTGGDINVLLPSFDHTGTSELKVGDSCTLSAQGNLTLESSNTATLDTTVYDIVYGGISIEIPAQHTLIKPTESLTLGNGNSLSSRAGNISLLRHATHNLDFTLRHYGFSVLDLLFPTIELTDTVAGSLSLGSGNNISAVGDVTLESTETLDRDLNLHGGTGSFISIQVLRNQSTARGSNTLTLGSSNSISAGNTLRLRARSTDDSIAQTTNIKVSMAGIAQVSKLENTSDIATALDIGQGVDLQGTNIDLEADAVTSLTNTAYSVNVGIAIDAYSGTNSVINDTSRATLSIAGGRIAADTLRIAATTTATLLQYATIGGGSLIYTNPRCTLEALSEQTATLTLGSEDSALTMLADSSDLYAANTYRHPYEPGRVDNVHGGGVGIGGSSAAATVIVKPTAHATVTLAPNSTLERLHKDAAHFVLRNNYHTAISAANDIESCAGIQVFSGGLFASSSAYPTLVTAADATLNIGGTIDSWNNLILTAYSHTTHESKIAATSYGIPLGSIDRTATISATDSITVSGELNCIGSITFNAGSAERSLTLPTGKVIATVAAADLNDNDAVSVDKDEQSNRRTAILSVSGRVNAGGDIAVHNDAARYLSGQESGAPSINSCYYLYGTVRAGLAANQTWYFSDSNGRPELSISASMKLFDGMSFGSDGRYHANGELTRDLYSLGSDGITLMPLILNGSSIELNIDTTTSNYNATDPSRYSNPYAQNLSIHSSSVQGLTLQGVLYSNRGSDLVLNGSVLRQGAEEQLRIQTTQASNPLTLTGIYNIPRAHFSITAAGDILNRGSVLAGSVDFTTGGDYSATSNGDYALNSPLSQYGAFFDLLSKGASAESVAHMNVSVTNSADSVPTLTAAGSITITALGYLDLNCRMTSGQGSFTIPEVITLSDSAGLTLSVAAAIARYEQDHTQSQYLINELRNVGVSTYFDAATRSIVVESPCERKTGIYLTGKLLNSDTSGTASLSVLNGYRDLVIDNKSIYTLQLGNIALNQATQGEIVLTDYCTLPYLETYRYTVDPNTGKTICTTTVYGYETKKTESSSYTPRSKHYLYLTRTRTRSYKRTWLSWNTAGTNPSYENVEQIGSTNWSSITSGYRELNDSGSFFAAFTDILNKTHTYYDPGKFRRYRHTSTWDAVRTDTLYIYASNPINISFFGASDGSSLTVNTNRSDICVGGIVSADRITLNSALAITARGTNLLHAGQIALTATGNIGSMSDFVNIRLEGGKLRLSSGGSAYIDAEGALPLDSATTRGSAYLLADTDITGSISCGDELVLYSDQGSITLRAATSRLSARAADNITIENTTSTNELLLGALLSESGSITLRSNGSIAADVNAEMTSLLSDQTLSHSLSLSQATNEVADSLNEHYHSELTRYTQLYFEQDSEGNYTHRDAKGYLVCDQAEETNTKDGLSQHFTTLYNEGKGEELVEFILSLSGTDYVGGVEFAGVEDAGSYIYTHTEDAAKAFADSQYDLIIRDLTQDIIANARQQGTAVVDYGSFTETQYQQYWERNADGTLRYQDAQGNFISPTEIRADGSSIPLYDADTCAAITAQFKDSTPVLWYLLDSRGNATLNKLANIMSGRSTAEQMLRQSANDLSIVAAGEAINTKQPVISAPKGSVILESGGNIGNESLRIAITPIERDENDNPVYGTWQQEFIDGVRSGSISGTTLVRREEDGTLVYSMSSRRFNSDNISELDFLLLRQAAESDVSFSGNNFSVQTHGYLSINAQSLTLRADGSIYVSSPGDITFGSAEISAGRELRLSAAGNISGGTLRAGSDRNVVLYAAGSIGSSERALTISGNSILNLTAGDNVDLTVNSKLRLRYMDGEDINVTLSNGASLIGTADHNGRADNPHITCHHITLTGSGYSLSSVGSGAEGALVINTHGLDGGALLESSTPNDILPLVRLFPTNTVYPFTLRTDNNVTYIDRLTIPYFGHIILGNALHVGSITFLQSNANAHSNSISTSSITIDRELNLLGEADFTTTFNDGIRFSGDGRINIDNPGKGTAFFEAIATGDNHRLSIGGRGNININTLDCGQLETALNGNLEVLLAEVADSARLSVGGNLILGFIDVRHFRADVGGSILVLWGETESFSATANGNIRALLTTADGAGVLPIGDVIATHGSVELMGDADDLNITGTIQGYHVALTSSGDIRRATGGNIRASRSYTPTRYADVYERQFSGGLIEFIDTLGINMSLDDSAGIAADTLDKLREAAEREISDHAEDTAPELRFINRDGSRATDAEQWNGATTDITTTTLTALSR
ncbi:MAG: beta strand repeat-containing protein, partial [Akkermansia sp.]